MKKLVVLASLLFFSCNNKQEQAPANPEPVVLTEEEEFEKAVRLMRDLKADEALAIFEKLSHKPGLRAEALSGMASCYLVKKDPQKALELFEASLKIDPEAYASLLGIASASLDLKKYEQALEYFRLARDNNGEFPDSYRGMAIAFDKLNQPDSALHYAKISLELNPQAQYDYDLQQLMKKYNKE